MSTEETALPAGVIRIEVGDGVPIDLVWVEPGRFRMGNSEALRPTHEVKITKGFLLGKTAVTQAQWHAIMGINDRECQGFPTSDNPQHPVTQITWNDANLFCERLSKKLDMQFRLPTEAEREYACRAGATTEFSFGEGVDLLQEYAWCEVNSEGGLTKPVGTRKPNAWGLYDMHGNVWEWVGDWYGTYPAEPQTDPRGPDYGSSRVIRGGSCVGYVLSCRASSRGCLDPDRASPNIGFRIARTL